MICKKCGREIADDSTFCSYCGENLQTETVETVEAQEKPSRTNVLAIIGFVLSFIQPIAGLVLSIIGLKKSETWNSGRKMAKAGIIISIVMIVLSILVDIATSLAFAFGNGVFKSYIMEIINNIYGPMIDSINQVF